ncbi:hypothetical protein TPHA_0C01220 [Tetrapisispora phaffii CBS 4417]|uniref:[histone H3]-dimethyl-L-lysine(36) demethylase n=1 Tax=Tetrapisispora phaffii (strain ATCC 24235 / CBS 4417 / NBRC 1672 / NRRL Y-8282 / UCD 70-5) TaxID=1071381 RepID=G8BRA2_TETPH|nr:hypothetical protein TPHA_0C01220 [Tetrapisispora phaffii CBS 4417]CCE62278.1 hypothetical protein TPHA_0C01220 [Tetrapisispora phaffii CBS 4417]
MVVNRKRKSVEKGDTASLITKKKYNLRTSNNQIDYISLNEGDGVKRKNEPPHLKSFNDCFNRYVGNAQDKRIPYKTFVDTFDDIKVPYLIIDPENSGMEVPDQLTVEEITKRLGGDCKINVMDVLTQENEKWTLSKWNEYFTNTSYLQRDRLKNVISFEVSDFAKRDNFVVKRPTVVSENDLVDIVWDRYCNCDGENGVYGPRPKVTKYVLMSVRNAYTDFHLDFAGTPVYYKLLQGSKKFILFPPTSHNIEQYLQWCNKPDQTSIFLGDHLQDGIAMELKASDLFLIPAGYIHVVYTPEDSLIVGGNFLTFRDILTHLKIVEVEKESKVPKTFTFPKFEAVMYKTAEWLIDEIESGSKFSNDGDLPTIIKQLSSIITSSKLKYSSSSFNSKKEMIAKLNSLRKESP